MTFPDFLIQDADGYIHLRGHRIGIQDVVHFYEEGYSPEMLFCEYPTLSLALIHKVIAFYLENQADVDAYLASAEEKIDAARSAVRVGPGMEQLRRRLASMPKAQGA